MIRHLLSWVLPQRARHREPQTEPPSRGRRDGAHADPAAPTLHLSAVRDAGTGPVSADDVPEIADGWPTPDHCPQRTDTGTLNHVGADESFGQLLAEMRHDLEHASGSSLDPVEQEWVAAFRAAEEAIELEAAAGQYRLHKALDAFAPGWRSEPPVAVANFAEAMELATTGELTAVTG